MKRNYTLNLCYVLCVVIVLLVYPVKNYSAILKLTAPAANVEKVEKPVAQQSAEVLHSGLLFKYWYYNFLYIYPPAYAGFFVPFVFLVNSFSKPRHCQISRFPSSVIESLHLAFVCAFKNKSSSIEVDFSRTRAEKALLNDFIVKRFLY